MRSSSLCFAEILFPIELPIACPCQENEQLSSNIIFEAVKLWFLVVYSDTICAVDSRKGGIIVYVLLPAGVCTFLLFLICLLSFCCFYLITRSGTHCLSASASVCLCLPLSASFRHCLFSFVSVSVTVSLSLGRSLSLFHFLYLALFFFFLRFLTTYGTSSSNLSKTPCDICTQHRLAPP